METIWHYGQRYYSLRDIYAAKIYNPYFFPDKYDPNESDESDERMIRRSVEKIPKNMYILVFRRNVSVAIPFVHENYANMVFFGEERL